MSSEKMILETGAKTFHWSVNGKTLCGRSSISMIRVNFGQHGDDLPGCIRCEEWKAKAIKNMIKPNTKTNPTDGWLPIKSAPLDGSLILLANGITQFTGCYGGSFSKWYHNDPTNQLAWPPPTHWMPLNELPTAISMKTDNQTAETKINIKY